MFPQKQNKWKRWGQSTWAEQSDYQWRDGRFKIIDVEVEQKVQGVGVKFSSSVSTANVEMTVSNIVSDNNYMASMINYLPWYEKKSLTFINILSAYDKEFRALDQEVVIYRRNMLLDTATEGLANHERDLGIEDGMALSNAQRREQISSRYISSFDQTTEETIATVASAYSNGEVSVSESGTPGVYDIKFIGLGIPDNMEGLKRAIDTIIPAHLGLQYTYSYTTWDELSAKTWDECSTQTWDEIREWEGDTQWY